VLEAFRGLAGIDLAATMSASGEPNPEALRAACGSASIRVAADDTWSDMFSRILVERVEPKLGIGRATVLERYPVEEAALARRCPDDPRVAERFEIYLCGVEIANGFGELTDPLEQRARFEAAEAERARIYGERYRLDEDFLLALAGMPEAAGVALGFDRLVMLAAGAERVDDVIWTPVA
jgi:lysyl-tRNA synthetase class 2